MQEMRCLFGASRSEQSRHRSPSSTSRHQDMFGLWKLWSGQQSGHKIVKNWWRTGSLTGATRTKTTSSEGHAISAHWIFFYQNDQYIFDAKSADFYQHPLILFNICLNNIEYFLTSLESPVRWKCSTMPRWTFFIRMINIFFCARHIRVLTECTSYML